MWNCCKRSSGTHWLGQWYHKAAHNLSRHGLSSRKLEQLTTKILKQNSNRPESIELWAKSIKHFGNFGRHFPAPHPQKSSQHVRACAAQDGAICSKNRKIVSYHRDSPNTTNGARLRSPSLIMAPVTIHHFSRPFATIRTIWDYSHYSGYSLFAIRDYPLFAIRFFQTPHNFSHHALVLIK